MTSIPNCIKCGSELTYENGNFYVCPECGHEWSQDSPVQSVGETLVVKDAHGNILNDGDSVTVIRDIKVKGSSSVIKSGTKIKDIRITEPVNGHNIDAKVVGFGPMMLKSELIKKCTS